MAPALFIITLIAWGTSWYALHFQAGEAPVEVSIFYRFAVAAVILGGWLLASGRIKRVPLRHHRWLALMGLFLFGLNFFLIYNATSYIPSGIAAVIFTMATIFNSLNQWIFLRKVPSLRVIGGSILGSLGILALMSGQTTVTPHDALIGTLLALSGTYMFSLGNLVSMRVSAAAIDLPNAIFRGMAWGAAGAALSAAASGLHFAIPQAPLYWASLLYLAAISSVAGFLAYLALVNRLGADKAAYVTVTFPIVALTISTFLENYVWQWNGFAGVALVLAGSLIIFARFPHAGIRRTNRMGAQRRIASDCPKASPSA